MSTIFPLHQTVSMVTARYLLDHDDNNSDECRHQAQTILRQLKTNLYTAVSKDVLHEFVTKFPKELTGELLCAMAPPHLKVLQLKKCQKIFDEAVQEPQCLNSVLQRCPKLQTLCMDGCDLHTSLGLCQGITQNAPSLSSISLENCLGVNDEMVQVFLRGFPGLKCLNLSLLTQITDGVFALDKEQDNSRDDTHSSPRPGCHLTSVELAGCRQLSSTCIRFLTEFCGPSLQSLNVANTGMDCTILWYLSGYSLTTAGQLAVLANKNLMGEDTMQGVQLAELLKDLKNLQQKLQKKIEEKEECYSEIENSLGEKQFADVHNQVSYKQDENLSRQTLNVDIDDEMGTDGQTSVISNQNSCAGCSFQKLDDKCREDQEHPDISLKDSKGMHSHSLGDGMNNYLGAHNEISNSTVCSPCTNLLTLLNTAQDNVHVEYLDNKRTSCPRQDQTDCSLNFKAPVINTRTKVEEFVEDILAKSVNVLQSEQIAFDSHEQTNSSPNDDDLKDDTLYVVNSFPVGITGPSNDISVCTDSIDSFVQGIIARSINALQNERRTCHPSRVMKTSADACFTSVSSTTDLTPKTNKIAEEDDNTSNNREDIKSSLVEVDDISLHIIESNNDTGDVQSMETKMLTASIEDNHSDISCRQLNEKLGFEPNKATQNHFSEGAIDNSINHVKSGFYTSSQPSQTTKRTVDNGADQISTGLGLHRKYTPAVMSLDISSINFDEVLAKTCLEEFFGANKGLRKLTLAWNQLQDSLLEIIATASSELQYLALYDSESITSPGLAQLLTYCPKLQRLELQGACFISDFGLSPLFMRAGRGFMTGLQLSETNVTNTSLECIAKYLGAKLTSLELSWCEEISEDGLAAISSKCTSLKTFHARQGKMAPDSLINLTQNCTGLTCLNLSSVESLTDDVVIEMARNLHQMKELDISWNAALTDSAVSSVMCNCPQLIELNIAGLKTTTEKPLLPIVADFDRWRRCLALIRIKARERRVLRISGDLQYSSDEEYEDLFVPVRSTSYVPNLRYIDVEYCDRMKDKVLAQIVAICRGTLNIKDYYGEGIVPKLLPSGL